MNTTNTTVYKHTCIACGSPCGYTGIFDSADCANSTCRYAGKPDTSARDAAYAVVYRVYEAAERFRAVPKCACDHEEVADLPSWCPDCQAIEQASEELFELIAEELGAKAHVPNA